MENNLDQLCFEHGIAIPIEGNDRNETIIQKSLGILQEDGIFAFFIYLLSMEGKEKEGKVSIEIQKNIGKLFSDNTVGLVDSSLVDSIEKKKDILEKLRKNDKQDYAEKNKINNELLNKIKNLTDDINVLLLAKSLIEKTLIYARYQAKSMGG